MGGFRGAIGDGYFYFSWENWKNDMRVENSVNYRIYSDLKSGGGVDLNLYGRKGQPQRILRHSHHHPGHRSKIRRYPINRITVSLQCGYLDSWVSSSLGMTSLW